MAEPAYTRLQVDERRRQLLELRRRAVRHATRSRSSRWRASPARPASRRRCSTTTSPASRSFFVATLQQAAEEIARRTEPDPDLPPLEALARQPRRVPRLDRGERAGLPQADRERRQRPGGAARCIDEVRDRDLRAHPRRPRRGRSAAAEAARRSARLALVHGRRDPRLAGAPDMTRTELRDLLLGSLFGSLTAAGWSP